MTKRVLIVEDDEELQELYGMMLAGMNCQIVRAYDGDEALEKLKKGTPDLIILDILLDEVMGDAVLLQLKEDPRYKEIPVIIASVLSVERCQHLLEMAPDTLFLRKPFHRQRLVEAVEQSLARGL